MKLSLISILVMFCVTTANISDNIFSDVLLSPKLMKKYHNGNFRNVLPNEEKLLIIINVEDGVTKMFFDFVKSGFIAENKINSAISYVNLYVNNDLEIIKKEMDYFYKDPSNLKIPIINAIYYSVKKFKGATKNELDSIIINYRKLVNK